LLLLLWAGRKIARIEQTEPAGDTRSCAYAQREVKFVQSTRRKTEGIHQTMNSFLSFFNILIFYLNKRLYLAFLCPCALRAFYDSPFT